MILTLGAIINPPMNVSPDCRTRAQYFVLPPHRTRTIPIAALSPAADAFLDATGACSAFMDVGGCTSSTSSRRSSPGAGRADGCGCKVPCRSGPRCRRRRRSCGRPRHARQPPCHRCLRRRCCAGRRRCRRRTCRRPPQSTLTAKPPPPPLALPSRPQFLRRSHSLAPVASVIPDLGDAASNRHFAAGPSEDEPRPVWTSHAESKHLAPQLNQYNILLAFKTGHGIRLGYSSICLVHTLNFER